MKKAARRHKRTFKSSSSWRLLFAWAFDFHKTSGSSLRGRCIKRGRKGEVRARKSVSGAREAREEGGKENTWHPGNHGHFRVALNLCFKARLSATKELFSHANKTRFYKEGFALSLVLKVEVFGTRKWLIPKSAIQEQNLPVGCVQFSLMSSSIKNDTNRYEQIKNKELTCV